MSDPVLTETAVIHLVKACMYDEGELKESGQMAWGKPAVDVPEGAIVAGGVVHDFVFDPKRVEAQKESIKKLLDELPLEFSEGGGWSFLQLCTDRAGRQWTGLHRAMEDLVVLGLAAKLVEYCAPREMWRLMPGGMPYLRVRSEKAPSGASGTALP